MGYIPSINIEHNKFSDFRYIVTENAKLVVSGIINGYNAGHHSFTIIGTYGTGKSSFILAFEQDLKSNSKHLIQDKTVLSKSQEFEFLNIVGDYTSLDKLLADKLKCEKTNSIDALNKFYSDIKKKNKFLVIVVDEFGKVLEHAANNNPEKELFFLQKLAEFVNVPTRNILLITTLHQNFGSYAVKLSESQRNEWLKVKGRFEEIVFAEPIEQLLYLTSNHIDGKDKVISPDYFEILYNLGRNCKFYTDSFSCDIAKKLFPLDPISAICLTIAIQRYGQNERTLFSILSSKGDDSISSFEPKEMETYNVAVLHDYLRYHFFSALNEANNDSMGWRALAVAIERVENSDWNTADIEFAKKIVKTIGLINIFFNSVNLNNDFLHYYSKYALDIQSPDNIIEKLLSLKVIRFASYKSQYVLFEGTDIDIESELYKAAAIVPSPTLDMHELSPYIKHNAHIASSYYYRTGTPRYFEYIVENMPTNAEPTGDIDGYIHLVFPLNECLDNVKEFSSKVNNASIYVYFNNIEKIRKHLYDIKKIQYVIDNVAFDDRVAIAELENQKNYETSILNEIINKSIIDVNSDVVWFFNGEERKVHSLKELNQLLSHVCDTIYYKTPIIRNELFNRQKISSAISLARVNLLDAMLNNNEEIDFGFPENSFPPEKTIYYTLLKESGIHRQSADGTWILTEPNTDNLRPLWDVCQQFLNGCTDKPKKLSELVKILKAKPYKIKQGVIDFWIPIFLYINQQNFALYNCSTFVLNINKEVFELLQKRLNDFSVKAYNISGVKLEFFKKYRQFLRKDDSVLVSSDSLIETIKPFFHFYRSLNNYAKNTRKFDSVFTLQFRDVLAKAEDPSKTFFEDLPAALGYKDLNGFEFVEQYIDLIKSAVRELNSCYDDFIERIEKNVVDFLGLSQSFDEYKPIMEMRYKTIDKNILPPKSKAFLDRVLTPSASRKEFFEKLGIIISNKRLEETRDSEEPLLIRDFRYLFGELERYSKISYSFSNDTDLEAFNFGMASSSGKYIKSMTYRLPKTKSQDAARLVERISNVLGEDDELNVCVLLKLLNDKIK